MAHQPPQSPASAEQPRDDSTVIMQSSIKYDQPSPVRHWKRSSTALPKVRLVLDEREELHAQHGIHEDHQEEQRDDVNERRQREHHSHHELAQLARLAHQPHDTQQRRRPGERVQQQVRARRDGRHVGAERGERHDGDGELEAVPRVVPVEARRECGELKRGLEAEEEGAADEASLVEAKVRVGGLVLVGNGGVVAHQCEDVERCEGLDEPLEGARVHEREGAQPAGAERVKARAHLRLLRHGRLQRWRWGFGSRLWDRVRVGSGLG
eukprot:6264205-Prymnesium_polylepis.1